jgi:hypothetical protein
MKIGGQEVEIEAIYYTGRFGELAFDHRFLTTISFDLMYETQSKVCTEYCLLTSMCSLWSPINVRNAGLYSLPLNFNPLLLYYRNFLNQSNFLA